VSSVERESKGFSPKAAHNGTYACLTRGTFACRLKGSLHHLVPTAREIGRRGRVRMARTTFTRSRKEGSSPHRPHFGYAGVSLHLE